MPWMAPPRCIVSIRNANAPQNTEHIHALTGLMVKILTRDIVSRCIVYMKDREPRRRGDTMPVQPKVSMNCQPKLFHSL